MENHGWINLRECFRRTKPTSNHAIAASDEARGGNQILGKECRSEVTEGREILGKGTFDRVDNNDSGRLKQI